MICLTTMVQGTWVYDRYMCPDYNVLVWSTTETWSSENGYLWYLRFVSQTTTDSVRINIISV